MYSCFPGIRPPPPDYRDALHYPKSSRVGTSPSLFSHAKYQPLHTDTSDKLDSEINHVYQTVPCERVFLYQPIQHYKNVPAVRSLVKFQYIHSYKCAETGKPLLVLEASTTETLASTPQHMGVKTYAQLEVIAAEDSPGNKLAERGKVMCAEEGVNGCDALNERLGGGGGGGGGGSFRRCGNDVVQSNGKAVLLPVNGIVGQDRINDRMIVESILSDVNTESFTINGSLDDLPPPPNEIYACYENDDNDLQTEQDADDSLTQALEHEPKALNEDTSLEPINALEQEDTLENEADSKLRGSGEITPLLQASNAQSKSPSRESLDLTETAKKRSDNDHEYADSGYSDCHRLEFKEHVSEHNTDHVVDNVIYSEPEYSSSDMSLKYTGDSPRLAKDKCQRTLKRTNNGVDHTVYELSPSDSFYNSTDNVQACDKRKASRASSEGICRMDQSSSSYTDGSKGRQPLNRETSVSFTKPLVMGPKGSDRGTRQSPVIGMQQQEAEADTEDAEPLVSPPTHNSLSSIPSHIVRIVFPTPVSKQPKNQWPMYIVVLRNVQKAIYLV